MRGEKPEWIGYLVLENCAVLFEKSNIKIMKCRKIKKIKITLNPPFKISENCKYLCINQPCLFCACIGIGW